MAYRLAAAFGTSAELWAGMQLQYDLYQAGKVKRPRIERLSASA
jgi:plasmid maintenance system antidote protein VapI